ncbi:MAG TPA: hypothetical protein GXX19_06385 [Syntrophomonadaceae bacterium]|nr:hypothetical protein [Syntrophomonadaceae bacterium]
MTTWFRKAGKTVLSERGRARVSNGAVLTDSLARDAPGNQEIKLLLKEMERLAAGQLAEPVDVTHYTGLHRDLAVCAEKIRQLIFGFAAELQVTAAQVASVGEQIQDAVTQSDHLVSAFDALKANAASIERQHCAGFG